MKNKKVKVSLIQNCPCEVCLRKDKLIVLLREKCISLEKAGLRKDGEIEYLLERKDFLEERMLFSAYNGLFENKKIMHIYPNDDDIVAILTNFKPRDMN